MKNKHNRKCEDNTNKAILKRKMQKFQETWWTAKTAMKYQYLSIR